MLKRSWLFALGVCALGLVSVQFISCGSARQDYTYKGAGSTWESTIRADGTFTLKETDQEPDLVVDGTYTTLSTGFMKLTVTSASGTGAPTAGSLAYGLEIPGVVFLLKPIGSSASQLIPMVVGGACPSADVAYNWIDVKNESSAFTISTADQAGTFQLSGTAASLPKKYAIDGTELGSHTLGTFSCSSGVGSLSGDTSVKMYMTANAGAIVHTSNNIIFATTKTALSGFSALSGDYAGLVFASDDYPVSMSMTSSGSMTVQSINVESGAQEGGITSTTLNATTAVNSPGDGFFGLNFATATTEKVLCTAVENLVSSGKSFIICTGDEPSIEGGGATQGTSFTALFIKK
jgi:hypothetical protein